MCFSISRILFLVFFPVLGFVFDIPHIFCYRASTIIQVWKISRERSHPSNSGNWFSTGWNVDHKNPGPKCLPNFMVDSEGLQAWDVWVSWRLDRVPGSMMLWWIPWTSHWPKLKSDDGKLTCWFYLIQGRPLILGIKTYIASSHIMDIYIFQKKHGTLGPFKIKRSLFTASSHVCIDVFLNLSTCMDRSM